jgi:protein phosphatase PTC7
VPGSATACILALAGPGRRDLVAANVGDSGFVVARGGALAFKSPQQQHGFNFPYQLGAPGSASDAPSDADTFAVAVRPGDVVVAGTDGLFDNVFADEAARLACLAAERGDSPADAASALAAFARQRAGDARALSPFAVAAQALGYPYTGGKMDDITVVVSYVEEEGAPAKAKL